MTWRMIYSFLRLTAGGCLVFGALTTIRTQPIVVAVIMGGIGLAILMQETAVLTARYLRSQDNP